MARGLPLRHNRHCLSVTKKLFQVRCKDAQRIPTQRQAVSWRCSPVVPQRGLLSLFLSRIARWGRRAQSIESRGL